MTRITSHISYFLTKSLLCLLLTVFYVNVAIAQTKNTTTAKDTVGVAPQPVHTGNISGYITDIQNSPMEGIIVRVLHLPDSAVVNGAATDSLGRYQIDALPFGNYMLRYSAVGYDKGELRFKLTNKRSSYNAPDITMSLTDITLGEAVVTGNATPVTVINDTVAYNAAAYPTTEGATMDELVQALPGAEITDDGKIKINGKEYSKILIDGKEFFGDDPQATLKNLPANIIKRIKTYDRKSAQARLTGIDDGVENNVIDVELKPNMFKGIVGNAGVSAGNHDRYNTRLNANRFRKDDHVAIVVNTNNVNNPAFSERGNGATNYSNDARSGLTASKSVGATFAKEKKDKYKISANARYGFTNADQQSDSHSETAYNNGTYRYGNNNSHSDRRRHEFNFNLEWEWKPDTLTTIQFEPNFTYNKTDNWDNGNSFSQSWDGNTSSDTVSINRHKSLNSSESEAGNESASFTFFRRLSRTGRNISFNSSLNYSDNNSNSNSRNLLYYFLQPTRDRNYSRHSDGHSFSMGYSLGFAYNEPIFKNSYLQLHYNYSYRHARSNRYGYQQNRIDSLMNEDGLKEWAEIPVDTALSSCNENNYSSHNIHINMRHTTPKLNLSYGVNLNPRHNETNYIFGPKMAKGLIEQNLMNWSPTVHFKYRFTKRNSFTLDYHGNSSDPDIDQLQEVIDKTNPQYIRYGNPGLKPSFTNTLRMDFNMYGEKSHRSLVTNWDYSNTNNTTSNMLLREASTGVSVSKLMNINGKWNMDGNINFNTPLDSMQRWNLGSNSSVNYDEYANYNTTPLTAQNLQDAGITGDFQDISFEDIDKLQGYALKNHTQALRLHQRFDLRFRMPTFSWKINAGLTYYKVQNSIKNSLCRETFTYNAGANMQAELPLKFEIATGMNFVSRHGFSSNIQKNTAIWNAQLTKAFFYHDAGLLSFQIFDILHQRSNINRTINNLTITDTHNLTLGSYFLVSFQYRLNTMVKNHRNDKGRGRQNKLGKRYNQNNRNRTRSY